MGALMSILGITLLEEIVNNKGIVDSDRILNELRKEVSRALRQKGSRDKTKEGIDISLCIIDRHNKSLQYSGAFNDLWIIKNNVMTEYKADKMTIDVSEEQDIGFGCTEISVGPGDLIYMSTDGFADQLGGPRHKKYRTDLLKNLLVDIHNLPLSEQKEILEKEFIIWKGTNPQTDDILVAGLKI
jgi:serine phosphatase RsbU (regulator of sigma subunit)